MTYIIATLQAWKLFALLITAGILMFGLMSYGGLGFVVAGVTFYLWLLSVTVELAKVNAMNSAKYVASSSVGMVAAVLFVLVPSSAENIGVALPAVIGFLFLGNMVYLMFSVGSLLAAAEKSEQPKLNAVWLVYAWPVGVWYLQPRLQNVLSK